MNLLFPGHYKRVRAHNWFIDEKDKLNEDNQFVIPSHYNDKYIDSDGSEFNTLTSEDFNIWVSSDSKRMVPVALEIFCPHISSPEMRNYIYFPKRHAQK